MDYFKIGDKVYDVLVVEVSENFNILYDSNTGRTLADGAPMHLSPIGVFYGHKITVKCKQGYEEQYDSLYNYISTPRDKGIPVELVHNQSTISYEAYISNGERKLRKIDEKTGKVYWGEFSLNIVPIRAYEAI